MDHNSLTMQKGAKARAQISIAASQLVEPMPVDRVKEIDPIDGHRTTKGAVRETRSGSRFISLFH